MPLFDDLNRWLQNLSDSERQRLIDNEPPPAPTRGVQDTPEEIENHLEEYRPDSLRQGLFDLGWFDDNLSSDARKASRAAYQERYGNLTSDEWAAWREWHDLYHPDSP